MDLQTATLPFPLWHRAWVHDCANAAASAVANAHEDTRGRGGASGNARSGAGSSAPGRRDIITPDLVAGVRSGNISAFEQLYRVLYARVLRVARRYTDSRESAEDVTHDAFLSLWDRRAMLDDHQDIALYVITTVRHRAFNATRHAQYVHRMEHDALTSAEHPPGMGSDVATAADRVEAESTQALLMRAVDALPELQRRVITFRWRTGMSYDAIAAELGITVKMVRMNLARAYEALRPLLQHLIEQG